MRTVQVTVLACRWQTLSTTYAVAPLPIHLLQALFSESPTVDTDGGWSLADFWVRATQGQLRFQPANVQSIGTLAGSVQGTASRQHIINLAQSQATQSGIQLSNVDPVIVFIDPPPSDAGALTNSNLALLDRAAEHTYFAHELGHTLGFEHSFGPDSAGAPDVYLDPYCIMSARIFGYTQPWATIPPPGVAIPAGLPTWFWSNPGACGSGPLAAAAQLYGSVPDFAASRNVVWIPYSTDKVRVLLSALGAASLNDVVLAGVETPHQRYFIEFRTAAGWDRGLAGRNPRPGIVIHKPVPGSAKSYQYVATIASPIQPGNDEWREPQGSLAVRFVGTVAARDDLAVVEVSALQPARGYGQLGTEQIMGAPAVVSWGPNRIDLFVQGTDLALYTKSWDGSRWSGYTQLGSNRIMDTPAVVSWGPNRIDLFVQGTDLALYTKSWDGSRWSGYTQLGPEPILGTPAVVSWGPNRIDVVVQGTDRRLYTKSWDGSRWSGYTQLGPERILGTPAVVSWGPNRIDVVVQGTDRRLYTKSWDGARWSGYTQLGPEHILSTPAVVSWGAGRIDVFVKRTDMALHTKSWDGSRWSGYTQLGAKHIMDQPAVVSWGRNRLDVVVQGTDSSLYAKSWDGSYWSDYIQLGDEQVVGKPAAVSWGPNRLDVFARGTDSRLYTKTVLP